MGLRQPCFGLLTNKMMNVPLSMGLGRMGVSTGKMVLHDVGGGRDGECYFS